MSDYNVCCLQSVISHYQEMSPSNLLMIMLIFTGVPPAISQFYHRLMLPGQCFPDPWDCVRYIMFEFSTNNRLYTYYCRQQCMHKKLRVVLCARVRDRCYTCKCH